MTNLTIVDVHFENRMVEDDVLDGKVFELFDLNGYNKTELNLKPFSKQYPSRTAWTDFIVLNNSATFSDTTVAN